MMFIWLVPLGILALTLLYVFGKLITRDYKLITRD